MDIATIGTIIATLIAVGGIIYGVGARHGLLKDFIKEFRTFKKDINARLDGQHEVDVAILTMTIEHNGVGKKTLEKATSILRKATKTS